MLDTRHLVVTVHGIRTYGNWQDDLARLLEEADPGVTVLRYRYGFFSSLAFLIPPIRYLMARQFRKFLVHAVENVPEGTRIDLVAHSFGTYLASSGLAHLPPNRKINTVIFAGSVLRPSFPWYKYLQNQSIGRVVNECGWNDTVLVLCQASALLMGMAGRIGFHGMVSDRFVNRYYLFGHGGYFDRDNRFMRENWLPLLTTNERIVPHDERPRLTAVGGAKLFVMNNMQFIKVAVALMLLLLVVWVPIDLMQKAEFQKRVERLNHIAMLTNAQEIPGSNPRHVRELLDVDARASGNSIDRVIGAQPTEDSLKEEERDDDASQKWYERLPLFFNSQREAFRARREHARANRQLVASKGNSVANLPKAQAHYEAALASYRRIKDYEPAVGSYALCLVDYANLLERLGLHKEAIEQFTEVREKVFPPDAQGRRPTMPPSLVVDTYIYECAAHKALQHWAAAKERLDRAVQAAEESGDPGLISDAYNESAWLHMDRLEIAEAAADFEQARDAATRLESKDAFTSRFRKFHVRHGQALAERLKGEAEKAYDQYEQIVTELKELMSTDMQFDPKQRADLRDRLINSMERRADVMFFARPRRQGTSPEAEQDFLDRLRRIEDDYQDAIERVGNSDLPRKTLLLYKKVVARFAAELELDQPRRHTAAGAEAPARRPPLDPIDLEFAEAERTYDGLSPGLREDLGVYRELSAACMELRRHPLPVRDYPGAAARAVWFPAQTVEKVRGLTVGWAKDCESMAREKVEMLLLALELLLHPRIEADPARLAEDSTRMMAVLGATTKVAAHPELQKYFGRFQLIASSHTAPTTSRPSSPVVAGVASAPVDEPMPGGDDVIFFLRLPGGRSLKIVNDPAPPPAAPAPRVPRLAGP